MIGIIGAMDEEVAALKEAMETEEPVERAGMTFLKGKLGGKAVTVVRSGIGKVNAGICAQILVSEFGADVLINTGIAGSLDARIDIGDMVISTDALYHDMDATAFGYPVGEVPRMGILSFPADERLVKLAAEANAEANPDIHTFTGRVVSGDQFVASDETKGKILENFGGLCTEMEGAAIAHAAYLNKVSCVIIRAISDKADGSASEDYPTFEKKAIGHSVRLVKSLAAKI
ncbi:MAG: 5'-methylthioadenosine/adenosylhomocysteine nucleosidase [Dorea sp.]|jgi:adenosylhomocysteine nucleosidase|nr:5'-methylthioadenosine/adenosylhomocysteine nucleosidase [Dorea sp.]